MEEQNIRLRQEAAEIVINECKQWLLKLMEEEMEKIKEDINQIVKARLTVENIAASFEEDIRRITEKEPYEVTAISDSDKQKQMVVSTRS